MENNMLAHAFKGYISAIHCWKYMLTVVSAVYSSTHACVDAE